MKYKLSKYNIFYPYVNGKYILYNSFSSAIILVSDEEKKLIENGFLVDEDLINQGIFIRENVDELKSVNDTRKNYINQDEKITIRILTTMKCNARCSYCFEHNSSKDNMSIEMAEKVAEFIINKYRNSKKVKICWFGGEPLLNIGAISIISSRLLADSPTKYYFSMVSNGSLFNNAIVEELVELYHLKSVQVTLDGYGKCYDETKKYVNPNIYNFESIINNIEKLLLRNVKVTIRINYIEDNYLSVLKLIDYLSQRFEASRNLHVYVYPVWNTDENGNYLMEDKEKLIDVLKKLVSSSLVSLDDALGIKRRNGQCMACNKYSYSIMPDGKLIKCTQDITHSVGSIMYSMIDCEEMAFWVNEDLSKECTECAYLPICQGGCVAGKKGFMRRCFYRKDIMPELLRWYIDAKLSN